MQLKIFRICTSVSSFLNELLLLKYTVKNLFCIGIYVDLRCFVAVNLNKQCPKYNTIFNCRNKTIVNISKVSLFSVALTEQNIR